MQRFLGIFLLLGCVSLAASETRLAIDGKAAVSVMHAQDASEHVRSAASDLAGVLGRMTGAAFSIESGGEARGIIVGTVAQFPDVPGAGKLDASDPLRREEYLIRTDGGRVWLIGATDAGASHAVWEFLHGFGYRQYFPGPDWEIVPAKANLSADLDVFASPSYKTRVFAWHFGNWPELNAETQAWEIRNRVPPPGMFPEIFRLNTSHTYGAVINQYRSAFDAEPAMRSIVQGKPTGKLNPAHPRTIEVLQQYALEWAQKNPESDCISMDPSDGGGWGTSPDELAIGTPSDRAVFIANAVATFLNDRFPGKFVGIYAYNEHSPAPTRVRVDPRVIVSFATAFIRGGFSVEELMQAWGAMGAQLMGIREYHSVAAWDMSRPSGGRAASLQYLAETLPKYHALGARFYTTEAGENWGSQGLGNYFTARAAWDLKDAAGADAMLDEFIAKCFPEAQETMRDFYRQNLHPKRSALLSSDLIGRMYRQLHAAREATTDPAARRRIEALIVYTRYSELLLAYSNARASEAPDDQQHAAMEALVKFAYRTRSTRMVSSLAIYRDASNPRRNKALQTIPGTDWKIPEGKNPWKNSEPLTGSEIDAFVSEGIAHHPLLEFEPVRSEENLVPATPLAAASGSRPPKDFQVHIRGNNQLLTWSDDPAQPIRFSGAGGSIYTNLGDVTVSLLRLDPEAGEGAGEEGDDELPVFTKPDAQTSLPPDKEMREILLQPAATGVYVIQTQDASGGFQIRDFPAARFLTVESSISRTLNLIGRTDFVFYVPKGTKIVGALVRGRGQILDDQGQVVSELTGESRYVSIPVPAGRDGSFWRYLGMVGGRLQLLTVPPYLAPSPAQMLLPREVVEADRAGG